MTPLGHERLGEENSELKFDYCASPASMGLKGRARTSTTKLGRSLSGAAEAVEDKNGESGDPVPLEGIELRHFWFRQGMLWVCAIERFLIRYV
jgi:hypothetical protein